MIYPLILAIVASGVVIFLLTFFIPRSSAGIFSQFGAGFAVADQIHHCLEQRDQAIWSVGVRRFGVLIFFMFYKSIATENGRRAYEKAILSTPLVGRLSLAFRGVVRFARMLGTLVGSGVPLIASLRVARQAIGNQTLSDTVSCAPSSKCSAASRFPRVWRRVHCSFQRRWWK